MPPRAPTLPADMWEHHIGPRLGFANLRAAHAASKDTRRALNAQLRKTTVTTSATVHPLVTVLKSAGVRAILNGNFRYYWWERTVKMGRYTVKIQRYTEGVVSVWWRNGTSLVLIGRWDGSGVRFAPGVSLRGRRGGATVVRLVKAAFKEAGWA